MNAQKTNPVSFPSHFQKPPTRERAITSVAGPAHKHINPPLCPSRLHTTRLHIASPIAANDVIDAVRTKHPLPVYALTCATETHPPHVSWCLQTHLHARVMGPMQRVVIVSSCSHRCHANSSSSWLLSSPNIPSYTYPLAGLPLLSPCLCSTSRVNRPAFLPCCT